MSDLKFACDSSFVRLLPHRWRSSIRQLLLSFVVAIVSAQTIPSGLNLSLKHSPDDYGAAIQATPGNVTASEVEGAVATFGGLRDFATPNLDGTVATVLGIRRLRIDHRASNSLGAPRTGFVTLQEKNVRLQI